VAVRRQSLVEQATSELQRLLASGEWPVGTRVPGELTLSKQLGVSRPTAREAMRSLVATGQLETRHGIGTIVVSATPLPELELRLRRSAIAEVYEVRAGLEVEAAKLAARRRTAQDVERLRAALAGRDAATSPAELVEVDLMFHATVVSAAHNGVLSEVFGSFLGALRAAAKDLVADTGLRTRPELAEVDAAHRALVDAIADGDVDAAVAATGQNVNATLEALRAGSQVSAPDEGGTSDETAGGCALGGRNDRDERQG
jgi:DNA-binding FadR family transcriptional regulator